MGSKVKGKIWERKMGGKLEARRKAMEEMPEMIRKWKAVSILSFLVFSGILKARVANTGVCSLGMGRDGRSIRDKLGEEVGVVYIRFDHTLLLTSGIAKFKGTFSIRGLNCQDRVCVFGQAKAEAVFVTYGPLSVANSTG